MLWEQSAAQKSGSRRVGVGQTRIRNSRSASVVFRRKAYIVMPAKAGIQRLETALDSGSRPRRGLVRNDKIFLERHARNLLAQPGGTSNTRERSDQRASE
jgi:hypothetical protein